MSLLKTPTTFEDQVNWKLHWLTCNLDNFRKLNTAYKSIDGAFALLHTTQTKFFELISETTITVDFDINQSDVLKEVQKLEKFQFFQESFNLLLDSTVAQQKKADAENLNKMMESINSKLKFS